MAPEKPFSFMFMRPEDAQAVGALARRIWLAHYPSIISVAQIEYMLARGYSEAALRALLENGQTLLATHEDALCGFLSIGPLAAVANPILRGEHLAEGGYFLHRFYIAPELHGKGLGKAMFAEILRHIPAKLLRLQVHRRNGKAHGFYTGLGFEIVAEADFDIGNGFQMQDYVMEWRRQEK